MFTAIDAVENEFGQRSDSQSRQDLKSFYYDLTYILGQCATCCDNKDIDNVLFKPEIENFVFGQM